MILCWEDPLDYSDKLIGSYDAENGSYETRNSNFDYLKLSVGLPYPDEMDKPSIFFFCSAKKLLKLDCLWLLGEVPLVSNRLADFLRANAAKDVELIRPLSIIASDSSITDDFFVVNAFNKVDVVDMEKSVVAQDDKGNIIYFKKTSLKSHGMEGRLIARDSKSRRMVVAKEFADQMIKSGFKGHKDLGFYTNLNCRFIPYKGQA